LIHVPIILIKHVIFGDSFFQVVSQYFKPYTTCCIKELMASVILDRLFITYWSEIFKDIPCTEVTPVKKLLLLSSVKNDMK